MFPKWANLGSPGSPAKIWKRQEHKERQGKLRFRGWCFPVFAFLAPLAFTLWRQFLVNSQESAFVGAGRDRRGWRTFVSTAGCPGLYDYAQIYKAKSSGWR